MGKTTVLHGVKGGLESGLKWLKVANLRVYYGFITGFISEKVSLKTGLNPE